MAGNQDEEVLFGENIDKSLFEENMVKIAQRLRRQGKSVFDLEAAKNEMSPEKDKYVLITIYREAMHRLLLLIKNCSILFYFRLFGDR